MLQGKQDSNFVPSLPCKGKGTSYQCTYLPFRLLLAKPAVSNQNQGSGPPYPGSRVSVLAQQPDARCTSMGKRQQTDITEIRKHMLGSPLLSPSFIREAQLI